MSASPEQSPAAPATEVGTAVSYVMPVLNEERYLRGAVVAVAAQEQPGPFELILALGSSSDSTDTIAAQLKAEYPWVRTVPNKAGSIPSGLNAAIAASRYDIIVRVDAHSDLRPGYTKRAVADLVAHDADVVGGIMDAQGRSTVQKAVAWAYKSKFGIGGTVYHTGGEAGPAQSAYLGVYRKERLLAVGGYDADVHRGEDWDLCQRIIADGGKVWFDPELSVTYWPRESLDKLGKQFFSTGVWRGAITKRHPKTTGPRYFVPPAAVLAIGGGLLLGLSGKRSGWLVPLAYAAGVGTVAARAEDLTPQERAALAAVLPTMHLSWGAGFIKGILAGAEGTTDTSRVG